MQPSLVIGLLVYSFVAVALFFLSKSKWIQPSQKTIGRPLSDIMNRTVQLQTKGAVDLDEPFSDRAESDVELPTWFKSSKIYYAMAISIIAAIAVIPFCILWLLPVIEGHMNASSSGIFVSLSLMWIFVPIFLIAIPLIGIVGKILLIPFPKLEAYSVIWNEVALHSNNLDKETKVKEQERLLKKAYNDWNPKQIAHGQWLPLVQLLLLCWIICAPLIVLFADDYVRIQNDGIALNQFFDLSEKVYDWDKVKSVDVSAKPAHKKDNPDETNFVIRFEDGSNVDIWSGANREPKERTLKITHLILDHSIPVNVQPLPEGLADKERIANLFDEIKQTTKH